MAQMSVNFPQHINVILCFISLNFFIFLTLYNQIDFHVSWPLDSIDIFCL